MSFHLTDERLLQEMYRRQQGEGRGGGGGGGGTSRRTRPRTRNRPSPCRRSCCRTRRRTCRRWCGRGCGRLAAACRPCRAAPCSCARSRGAARPAYEGGDESVRDRRWKESERERRAHRVVGAAQDGELDLVAGRDRLGGARGRLGGVGSWRTCGGGRRSCLDGLRLAVGVGDRRRWRRGGAGEVEDAEGRARAVEVGDGRVEVDARVLAQSARDVERLDALALGALDCRRGRWARSASAS